MMMTPLYNTQHHLTSKLTTALSRGYIRCFSQVALRTNDDVEGNMLVRSETAADRRVAALVQPYKAYGKVKPRIANQRLSKMRVVEGKEKSVRGSPWKLNLVCKFVAGLPVSEALRQLSFCKKQKAPLVYNVIRRTANLADIRHGLQPSQLEVAECYSTSAATLKRIQFHARGRHGKKYHRFSHLNLKLREIDFELKVAQAPNLNQKKKWFALYHAAKQDAEEAKAERDEIKKLEQELKQVEEKKRMEGNKK